MDAGDDIKDLPRASSEELSRELNRIDVARKTAYFVSVLEAKCNKDITANATNAEKSERLCAITNAITNNITRLNSEDIKPVVDAYIRVFQNLATAFLAESNCTPGVFLLRNAIVALIGSRKVITSLHGRFFELCAKAKEYDIGQSMIKEDARELFKEKVTSSPDYDVKSVLHYYFYAGTLLCQAERFEAALRSFMLVLVIPSSTLSPLLVEAYKKFVLINLILGSPVKELPSNISCGLERGIRPKCPEYDDLARVCRNAVYGKNVIAQVATFIVNTNNKTKAFETDGNEHLCDLVLKRIRYDCVMRVAQTFKTIKLQDMVSRSYVKDMTEAEEVISELVEAGRLLAEFDKATDFIKFDFPEIRNINVNALNRCAEKIEVLKVEVGKYDDEARSHRHYVIKQGNQVTPPLVSSTPSASTNDDEGFGAAQILPSLVRPPVPHPHP